MYHYDAFISYNHNPRDIQVTKNLQRRLENYRIPKGTKTSTGKEKIERVFLDTGELEAAGDLSKVLQDALDNSDDLIVICSPESRASIWVHREIEYFLKSHPVDRVHTVLTDGEPIDVLPEILLSVETEDENGNTVRIPREPLSCDYRLPLKKANQGELPRLVAAILGCRYDDLMQRQKQYRMKRQISLLAAAAVFLSAAIGYLAWSNQKIKANYEKSLREESLNLASQSEQALARGDRISAIRYALDALPSENKERPVVPKAVEALSNAIDLYKTPRSEEWKAIRLLPCKGNNVNRFCSAEVSDRSMIAVLFSNGKVSLRDTGSGQEIMADYTETLDGIRNIEFSDSGKFILVDEKNIYVLDPAEEKELRKISFSDDLSLPYSHRAIANQFLSLAIAEDSLWIPVSKYEFDEDSFEGTTTYELLRIDLKSGATLERHSVTREPDFIQLSSDGRYLAFVVSGYYLDDDFKTHNETDILYIIDTHDKEGFKNAATVEMPAFTNVRFFDRKRLLFCGLDKRPMDEDLAQYTTVDITGSGRRSRLSDAVKRNILLGMADASTGQILWDDKYSAFAGGVPALEVREKGQAGWDFLCYIGDDVRVMDAEGSELVRFNTSSNIAAFFNTEDLIRTITVNGEIAYYDFGEKQRTTRYNSFVDPVQDAEVCEGGESIFISTTDTSDMSQSESIMQYKVSGADEAYSAYEYGDDAAMNGTSETYTVAIEPASEGRIVEIRSDNSDDPDDRYLQVLVRDSESGKILLNHSAETAPHDEETESAADELKYSGISSSGDKAYFAKDLLMDRSMKLMSVDLTDGSEETVDIVLSDPEDHNTSYSSMDTDYTGLDMVGEHSSDDGMIHYLLERSNYNSGEDGAEHDYMVVLSVDPETGMASEHVIRELGDSSRHGIRCKVNGACERVLYWDTKDEEMKLICYDFDGNTVWENDSVPSSIYGMMIIDDGSAAILEVRQEKALLHHLSEKDGAIVSSTEISGLNHYDSEKLDFYKLSEDEIMVAADNDAFILDPDTWEIRSLIAETYITYEPENKQFMLGTIYSDDRGHVPYRTLDEMILEAQKSLE